MIQIKPINIPLKGIGTHLKIRIITHDFPTNYVLMYYSIIDVQGNILIEGNIKMDENTYSKWGTDDNFVVDWILNELNLKKYE